MKKAQVIIIGGGLAGLTAAIDLCKHGLEVVLFEKTSYPQHKVCGEYLSTEIIPYFEFLGLELERLQAPEINKMEFSLNSGETISCDLKSGGLGISRFTLDHYLYKYALSLGCQVIHASVENIEFIKNEFHLQIAGTESYKTRLLLGAYGKRSGLDKILSRDFIGSRSGWLAVKAHYINENYPDNLVSLHNFKGGYCGLSRTELNTINVCYLASYKSFKKVRNTQEFKEKVLMRNPRLQEFFKESKQVFEKELSIAQVSFKKRSLVEKHILMLGDAAGLIHPLCGNGMAMAVHSAKIVADSIRKNVSSGTIHREGVEYDYMRGWHRNFNSRLRNGRILQNILLHENLTSISQNILKAIPGLMPQIIKSTHGKPIYV